MGKNFSNFMELLKSVEFWTKVAGVCAAITLLFFIYDRYIKPIICPPTYLESLSAQANELTGKNTVNFPDSIAKNEDVRHIVTLQDRMKSSASEFLSSVAKRKELAGMDVGPQLASALKRDIIETNRPLYILQETMNSITLVGKDLNGSSSKWNDVISKEKLGEISEALKIAIQEQNKCDSIISHLLAKPNLSNSDISKAVKEYESLYENEKYMGFYRMLFEWYNKLFDQLNGRLMEIKNQQQTV